MARNQSGVWNKILDFIGIVDDDRPVDTYDENEYSGRSRERYARGSGSRQNRTYGGTSQRASDSRSQRRPRYEEPAPDASDNYAYDAEYDEPPRRGAAADRTRSSTRREAPRGNRDDELEHAFDQPSKRAEAPARRQQHTANPAGTVMYTLFEWADCVDVIEYLIRNNSVVLNISRLSPEDRAHAMDTLSGAAYALRAMIKRSSDDSYLIAPSSTTVSIDAKIGGRNDDDITTDYAAYR